MQALRVLAMVLVVLAMLVPAIQLCVVLRRSIFNVSRRCARCGYNRSDDRALRCPECGCEGTIGRGVTGADFRRAIWLGALVLALVGGLVAISRVANPYSLIPTGIVLLLAPDRTEGVESKNALAEEAVRRIEDGWRDGRAPTGAQLGEYFESVLKDRLAVRKLVRQWQNAEGEWVIVVSFAHRPAVSEVCWMVVTDREGQELGEDVIWPWFLSQHMAIPQEEFEMFASGRDRFPESVFLSPEQMDHMTLHLYKALGPAWPTADGLVPPEVREHGPFCSIEIDL